MSADDAPLNPYQPTTEISPSEAIPDVELEPTGLARVAARWFTVCGISALPSFFFGFTITGGQLTGMLLGIVIFAVGYTLLDYKTAEWAIRQKKTIRRTLRFTYGTRIAISIIFPVGMYLDLICGIFSMGIVAEIMGNDMSIDGSGGESMSFVFTLITTLVQGCILNVVLGVYGLIVLGVHAVVNALKR